MEILILIIAVKQMVKVKVKTMDQIFQVLYLGCLQELLLVQLLVPQYQLLEIWLD